MYLLQWQCTLPRVLCRCRGGIAAVASNVKETSIVRCSLRLLRGGRGETSACLSPSAWPACLRTGRRAREDARLYNTYPPTRLGRSATAICNWFDSTRVCVQGDTEHAGVTPSSDEAL